MNMLAEPKKFFVSESVSAAASAAINSYLGEFKGKKLPSNLHREVIDEVEKPLLENALKFTNGNQSKAAMMLGINRATLRTKMKRHGML